MPYQTRNVFISHIHEDDDGLRELKSLLGRNGMTVRDYSINSDRPNNAKSPEYIKSQILAPRIQDCSVLLVYITPDTKHSEWVAWEIEYARRIGKRIVGVWAHGEKGCDLPEALDELADAVVGWRGTSIIDAINGKDDFQEPDGTPWPSRQISRAEC